MPKEYFSSKKYWPLLGGAFLENVFFMFSLCELVKIGTFPWICQLWLRNAQRKSIIASFDTTPVFSSLGNLEKTSSGAAEGDWLSSGTTLSKTRQKIALLFLNHYLVTPCTKEGRTELHKCIFSPKNIQFLTISSVMTSFVFHGFLMPPH